MQPFGARWPPDILVFHFREDSGASLADDDASADP